MRLIGSLPLPRRTSLAPLISLAFSCARSRFERLHNAETLLSCQKFFIRLGFGGGRHCFHRNLLLGRFLLSPGFGCGLDNGLHKAPLFPSFGELGFLFGGSRFQLFCAQRWCLDFFGCFHRFHFLSLNPIRRLVCRWFHKVAFWFLLFGIHLLLGRCILVDLGGVVVGVHLLSFFGTLNNCILDTLAIDKLSHLFFNCLDVIFASFFA
mmetsp:Transcript_35454/g.63363  ORF Transcript_35454/g.63363 Transcript_35454/m.63363 type:complete len:208 (+) Transcript_35454:662-1285(+)